MEPLSLLAGGIGLGLQLFGAVESSKYEKEAAQDESLIAQHSQNIARIQQQIEAQKFQQMNLNTQRANIQQVRNMQRLRAAGVSAANSQGAAYGSGLQGGLAGIAGGTGTNVLGLSQNLGIGTNIYGLTGQESLEKINIAGLQGAEATAKGNASLWQGIGGAGGGLFGGAMQFGRLFAGVGQNNNNS